MTLTTIFLICGAAGLALTILTKVLGKSNNLLISFLQHFSGAFFIFSGVVKAIDPLGTAYKMQDYFTEFETTFEATWFSFIAPLFPALKASAAPFAVFMIVLELVVGVCLITGFHKRIMSIFLLALLVFFAFLTGFTHLTGYVPDGVNFFDFGGWGEYKDTNRKVTDCGCFGDFLKLEPKVSFYKDLILLIPGVLLLIFSSKMHELFEPKKGLIIAGLSTVISLVYCWSNYVWDIPAVDFRPYAIGNDINELRTPKRMPNVEFEFVYANAAGEEKAFAVDALGTKDSTFSTYVRRKENVIDPGIPAKITNFDMMTADGGEVTDEVLHNESVSYWFIAYDINKSDEEVLKDVVAPFTAKAIEAGVSTFIATASNTEKFTEIAQFSCPIYTADGTFLKTMIRANPGLIVVKNGIVLGKYHHSDIPSFDEIQKIYQ